MSLGTKGMDLMRKHESASHIAMGAVIFGIFEIATIPLVWMKWITPLMAIWLGVTFVIAFYYGRERRDHEIHSGLIQRELAFQGWGPWSWNADGYQDFLYPLGAFLALGVIASVVLS
jgi:hypothetical protein